MASVKQLEDIISSVKSINKSLLDDLLTLKEDKKLTNTQLNAALTAREKAETKYNRMKKELEETIKKSEDKHASFGEIENELSKLKVDFESCNQELIESKKKCQELDLIIDTLKMEKKELEEKLKELQEMAGSVADRDKNIDSLTKENKDLVAKVSHYETERSKYEKIKGEESKKRIEAEQYAVGLEKRAQELEERIDRETKMAKDIKDQSRTSQDDLKSQLEKEKLEKKAVEDELNEYKTLFEREQSNREKIEEDTTAIKKQRATFEHDLKTEKTKASDLETEVSRLKQQLQKKDLEKDQVTKLLDREKETNATIEDEWNREKKLFKSIKLDLENQLQQQLQKNNSNNNGSNEVDIHSMEEKSIIVGENSDSDEQTTTIVNVIHPDSSSSSEKQYLKEWEERLEKQNQQLKLDRIEFESFKKEMQQQLNGHSNGGGVGIGMVGNSTTSELEVKVDELMKTLEGERKVRIKLEEQLQQLHPSSNGNHSNSGNSGGASLSVPPSPSKGGVTNTLSSLFSRRNLSIPDFSSSPNGGSKSNGSTSPPLPPTSDQHHHQQDYPQELVGISDEERKTRLFAEYQQLLVDCNTLLYSKRDQLTDLEKEGKFIKKFHISSIKTSITKLEPLQDRVKKNLKAIDSKPSVTMNDDIEERSIIKSIRLEIDNES